jgi:hypothetical protein
MASNSDEKLKQALESMKDHASSIAQYVESLEARIEDLERLKAEAEERTDKAEEKARNAEDQYTEVLKKLGQVEARESTNYAPLIKELFKEPHKEFQTQIKNQSRWFFAVSSAVAVLAVIISSSIISSHSVRSGKITSETSSTAPSKSEAKLFQALARLDEKTQQSIDRISLETARIAENISYITEEQRLADKIVLEIDKFQKEFAPVRSRNDIRLLYKMRLSPHHQAKYVSFYEAMKKSNIPADLVPTNLNDFYIWDKQMLHIFTRLLRKAQSVQDEYDQLPNEILRFSNYKDEIDATRYGVWSIEIEDYSQLLAYLKKQIDLYRKQILGNNREL